MPTTVDVPGLGSIDFPDTMPPEQIHAEISKQVGLSNLIPPQQDTLSQGPGAIGQVLHTLRQGLNPIIGMPSNQISGVMPSLQNKGIDQVGLLGAAFNPHPEVPWVLPQAGPQQGTLAQVGAGLYNPIAGLINSMTTSPGGLMTLGAGGGAQAIGGQALPQVTQLVNTINRIMAGGFGAQIASGLPQETKEGYQAVTNPQATVQQKVQGVVAPLLSALVAGGATSHALGGSGVEPAMSAEEKRAIANETTGTQYKALLNPPQERGTANPIPQQPAPIQLANQPSVLDTLSRVQQQLKEVSENAKEVPKENEKQEVLAPTPGGKAGRLQELKALGDRATPEQAVERTGLQQESDSVKAKMVASFGKVPSSDVSKVTPEYAESEKQQGRGGFVLETPMTLADKSKSGFAPEARPDSQQLLGRLENMGKQGKVSLSELSYYKEQGLEDYLKTKPTVSEVGKWMQKNGPKVEVKKYGQGSMNPEQRRFNELDHIIDSSPERATINHYLTYSDEESLNKLSPEAKKIVEEYIPLNKIEKHEGVENSHWGFVAPKAEKDMPGYVEVVVTRPGEVKHPSAHNFPANSVGFGRMYFEQHPEYGKVAHVVEVQSDWAQKARDMKERANEEGVVSSLRPIMLKDTEKLQDPLLAHHETLVLKALISHAREQSADAIAMSDAETAMMSEGHDSQASIHGEDRYPETGIPQEAGMRLHYDRILPSILQKLTGGKEGERVEFGEHEKAFTTERSANPWDRQNNVTTKTPRKNLIFRNADSTPKTSITARLYPLDSIKQRGDQPFTVFGKRYSPDLVDHPTTFTDATKSASRDVAQEAKQLGLKDGITAHELVGNIIKNKEYSEHDRALAGFLNENFEHILRAVPVEQAEGNAFDLNQGKNNREPGTMLLDASQDYNRSLHQRALHEAVHAVTEWASEYPATATQRAAVDSLNGLLKRGTESLPSNVGEFVVKKFRPLYDEVRTGKKTVLDMYRALDDENLSQAWMPRLYAMTSRGEMLAQMFSDRSVFDWLNSNEDKGYVSKIWDGIKQLLGVKKGSIVEQALDTMRELGAERNADEWQPQTRLMDAVEGKLMPGASALPTDVGPARSTRDVIEANLDKLTGKSAPFTMKANRDVGNKLVRYASARIAAPQIGEAMASGVLGEKFKDTSFDKDLGRVMVQDRLNALRNLHTRNGDTDLAAKVSNVMPDADFKALLARPDIKAALDRHVQTVQKDLEKMHRFLGGKMSVAGKETGAFVNLVALLNPDDVDAAKSFIYGSRKGDITNPLKKGSAFGQKATGTAEAYEESYRVMVTRAYRGNYEEYAKQKLYDAYQKAGLGVEEKLGVKPPTFGGQPAAKVPVDRRGGKVSNLWVRRDLAPELRQALQTDSPVDKSGLMHLAGLATELQVMGPTDFVFHMGNMLAALNWSQGSKGGVLADAARKLPLIGWANTAGELGKAMREVWLNHPDTQKELAEIAAIGAGRAEARHSGLVSKGLEKVGVPEGVARKIDPNYYTSRVIKFMDKSGRLVADSMFDKLVERGWAKDSEGNRREFINRMGQYNERLMTQTQQRMRDMGLSPFVTAGRTFNRLALQRLLQSPGFEATSPQTAAKARLVETLGTASVMFALPIAWNLYMTGKPFGNAGIPNVGALDLNKKDKEGKELYFDLLQGNLERRALRITGLQTMDKDLKQGDSLGRTSLDMGKAIVEGVLNPWEGPGVKAGKIAMTGKDMNGFLVSRNPENTGENLKAALMNLNSTIATLFGGEDKGAGNTAMRLAQVAGLKAGTQPTFEERADEQAKKKYNLPFASLPKGEQATITRSIKDNATQRTELAERSSGERAYWSGVQRKDDLSGSMPQDVAGFIKQNKLQLPGFEETQVIDKERVPLTNADRKKFEAVVAKKYELVTRRFMSNPEFETRNQASKQAAFSKGMSMARKQAWAEFRRSSSSAQPAP